MDSCHPGNIYSHKTLEDLASFQYHYHTSKLRDDSFLNPDNEPMVKSNTI